MARFKIFLDQASYWRWRLVAGNGEIIANSEAYATHANALRSAERVKYLASVAIIEN